MVRPRAFLSGRADRVKNVLRTGTDGKAVWSCMTLEKSLRNPVVIVMEALDAPRAKWEQ